MIRTQKVNTKFIVLSMALLATCIGVKNVRAEITASTSLTIVHVTEFKWASNDLTQWPTWPTSPNPQLHPDADGVLGLEPDGLGVYLDRVDFSSNHMSWDTAPYDTPYTPFANGINSMIAAVWSEDNGRTFIFGSWDYLASHSHSKGIEGGMPDCWMGTLIHSICDRKPGECNNNERYRSNLYFAEFPIGEETCWGTVE